MSVQITTDQNTNEFVLNVTHRFSRETFSTEVVPMIFEAIVDAAVKHYTERHLAAILASIDPRAVANLAIARAATEIAKELRK